MITISITQLLVSLLIIAGIVLVIFLTVMIGKLLPVLTHLNKIMADAEVITAEARSAAENAKGTVNDLAESFKDVNQLIKGNKSFTATATNLINAAAALRGLLKK